MNSTKTYIWTYLLVETCAIQFENSSCELQFDFLFLKHVLFWKHLSNFLINIFLLYTKIFYNVVVDKIKLEDLFILQVKSLNILVLYFFNT